jgi:hypothetical protein
MARDTATNFPEVEPVWREGSGSIPVAPATYRGAASPGEAVSTLEGPPAELFRPLLYFLVLPLGLAAIIALGSWMLRMML